MLHYSWTKKSRTLDKEIKPLKKKSFIILLRGKEMAFKPLKSLKKKKQLFTRRMIFGFISEIKKT